jgi:hypothetical protein
MTIHLTNLVASDHKKYKKWYLNCANKESMCKGGLKKRKQEDEELVSLRELGWTLTYEDDMGVDEEANQEETGLISTMVDNNENWNQWRIQPLNYNHCKV